MNFDFLFWLFFIGLIVATLQDLKRREVDNWLNLFLLVSSVAYVVFDVVFRGGPSKLFILLFMLGFMFVVAHACYYGRVFAGGDAKLLFAMTVFFISSSAFTWLLNIGVFMLLLLVCGSIYGILYAGYLYRRDFARINAVIREHGFERLRLFLVLGVLFAFLGFWNSYLFIFAGIFFVLPFVYSFAHGIETVSMTRAVKGSELREGDWLVTDVKVGKRIVRADWDGLSKEDVALMKRLKKVVIREGIPFVPAFLLAFICYVFFREPLFGFL